MNNLTTTTKPRSTEARIEAAIDEIIEIRLNNLLGINREEVLERNDRGELVYGDEFNDTFHDVKACLDDLFS